MDKLPPNEQEHIDYLDLLRLAAIFFVMVLHVAGGYWYDVDLRSFEWKVLNIYDATGRWGVPVLIMISGVLFLGKDRPLKRLYRKNILRIFTAFVFWSVIYAVMFHSPERGREGFISEIVVGYYHLWFLYMLLGLYIVSPLLRRIAQSETALRYFLVLSFVFAILVPRGLFFISVWNKGWADLFGRAVDEMRLFLPLGFSFYFMLGYYLSRRETGRKTELACYALGVFGLVAMIVLTACHSRRLGEGSTQGYDALTVNALLMSVAVFTFGKNRLSGLRLSDRARSVVRKLSQYSFGAYLIHAMLISLLDRWFGLNALSFQPILSVPVIAVGVCAMSFALSALLHRIPLLNKYIV